MKSAAERIIVALDRPTPRDNLALTHELDGMAQWYKVGSALFCRQGPQAVRDLKNRGLNVFLDLKFHDIPNTVALSVGAACELGADYCTVHSSGGSAMLRAAAEASRAHEIRCKVLAVTILTSRGGDVEDAVRRAAELAQESGCDGVICSPHEAACVRADRGPGFLIITPGIRLVAGGDDQARVATPSMAVGAGADQLVIGRPIYKAPNSAAAFVALERDLAGAA